MFPFHPNHQSGVLLRLTKDGKLKDVSVFGGFTSRVYLADENQLAECPDEAGRIATIMGGFPVAAVSHDRFNQLIQESAHEAGLGASDSPPATPENHPAPKGVAVAASDVVAAGSESPVTAEAEAVVVKAEPVVEQVAPATPTPVVAPVVPITPLQS